MIKANELRIGNYADYEGRVGILINVGRNHSGISFGVKTEGSSHRNEESLVSKEVLSAIPLTEELLLKFGGVKDEDKIKFKLEPDRYIELIITKEGIYPFLVQLPEMQCEDLMIFPCLKIDYVHEFQNLYFVVSGEELELKQ